MLKEEEGTGIRPYGVSLRFKPHKGREEKSK